MKLNIYKKTGRFNNSRGITLIALVVTIVVLLILASISIANIAGNDASAKKAEQARNETEVQAEMEMLQQAIDKGTSKNYLQGNFSGSADVESIKKALSGLIKDTSVITGTGPWEVEGNRTGTKYSISKDNKIMRIDNN